MLLNGWYKIEKPNNIVYRKLNGEKQGADFDVKVIGKQTFSPNFLKDYIHLRSSMQMKWNCFIGLYQSTLICSKQNLMKIIRKLNNE